MVFLRLKNFPGIIVLKESFAQVKNSCSVRGAEFMVGTAVASDGRETATMFRADDISFFQETDEAGVAEMWARAREAGEARQRGALAGAGGLIIPPGRGH